MKLGSSVQIRQLSTSISRPLDVGKGQYRRLVWSDSTDALAALRVVTDTSGADEDAAVLAWSHASRAGDKADRDHREVDGRHRAASW